MKSWFHTLVATCLLISPTFSNSQEKPRVGYLRIVNLISSKSPTTIQFGDIKLNGGKAVPAGSTSGILGINAGNYEFTVANAEAKPAVITEKSEITADITSVLVIYSDIKTFKNGDIEKKVHYSLLKRPSEKKGPQLRVISVCENEKLPLVIGKREYLISPRKSVSIPVELDNTYKFSLEKEHLGEIEFFSPTQTVAFLYDDLNSGKPKLEIIHHIDVEYDPPMDDQKLKDFLKGTLREESPAKAEKEKADTAE